MSLVISVSGSSGADSRLFDEVLLVAEEVGAEVAKHDAVLLTGGKGGVMRAACKGAKSKGGTTIGILPFSKAEANEFVDIVLPSNMGYGRNRLVVTMADAVIAIAGRWGTLNEISEALMAEKPLVFLLGCDGVVDRLSRSGIVSEDEVFVDYASSAKDAVGKALNLIRVKKETKD
ncbi:MAG TPA: TIGR00725 family protein [Candidatus Thermoplasmatota archaeon]|nr:TIGR00725 family protein [Candidatus Thermoplasmatota archaeon]